MAPPPRAASPRGGCFETMSPFRSPSRDAQVKDLAPKQAKLAAAKAKMAEAKAMKKAKKEAKIAARKARIAEAKEKRRLAKEGRAAKYALLKAKKLLKPVASKT